MPNTPLLNRYREDENIHGNTRLPSGPCNYVNLSIGKDAKCGCRRFTELQGVGGQTRPGLCFCEHHSCFHDHDPVDGPRVLSDVSATGGMSLTPKPSVYRQSPIQRDHHMQDEQPEVGPRQKRESLPDTLQWSRFINSGASLGSFPAIPSQCLLPSDDGSRASTSQPGNMRPFAGLGLNTLSHIPKPEPGGSSSAKGHPPPGSERRLQVYQDSHGNPFLQSLTEVATPSLRASQNLDDGIAFGNNIAKVQNALQRISEERSQGTMASRPDDDRSRTGSTAGFHSVARREEPDENLLPRLRSILNHVADHPMKIQNHEQRLDQLENASFTNNPAIDEIQETNEHLDTRVGLLESRVDDLERARLVQSDTGSFAEDSRISNTSSALIAAAIDRVDYNRIEALEAQVSELQASAPPSHAHPWEFEVVFLPFGSRLNGVWSTQHPATQRSRMNSTVGDDVTQTQYNSMAVTQACLTAHDQGVAWESSMKSLDDHNDPLMPRACGLRSRIGERLRSRGLVRSIQIKGADARDVQAAMLAAFGDLPMKLAEDPFSHHGRDVQAVPKSLSNYLGLHALWVPLRKLHKDDNLRFLNASEMITPALWTVHFLASSVAMRAHGTRRLYVTQSDSYIQHLRDESAEWTWQKLRQLPRVYSDAQSSFDHTPEADAHEPCWEFDERLDPPPSIHSSFASHHSVLSLRPSSHEQEMEVASASEHSSTSESPIASTTPTSIAPPPVPLSPLKERHQLRPLHTRTTSMPSLIPIKSSPSMTKRRIASFELESQTSPTRAVPLNLKRRRISRSPSRPRDTPRWSVGPPSPYTFVDDILERSKRGTTPFAYATPHSNTPYIEASRHMRDDEDEEGSATDEIDEGYDRHALSDYDSDEASGAGDGHQPDEEWEGVQDDESRNTHTLASKTFSGLRQDDEDEDGDGDGDEDMASEASSSPSEYPSRQPEGSYDLAKAGFRIHVDEEVEDAH